jgi:hypothetical protein
MSDFSFLHNNLTNEDIIAIYSLGPNFTNIYYDINIIARIYNIDSYIIELIWNNYIYTEITNNLKKNII